MKVLVIAPTPYFSDRGCHIRIWQETEALQRAGHDPVVFTYHLGRNVGTSRVLRSRTVRWYKKTEAGPSWAKLYLDVLLWWRIVRASRQEHYDVVHAHLHEGMWIAWLTKPWVRKPIALDAQGSLVAELDAHGFFRFPGIRWIFKRIERFLVRRADVVFASSPALHKFLVSKMPEKKDSILLVPDGVLSDRSALGNTHVAQNAHDADSALQSLQLNNTPVVLYAGGFSRVKGFDALMNAIPLLLKRKPGVHVVLIGYPDAARYKKKLEQAVASERQLLSSVHFLGRVPYEQLQSYLQLATVAVDPKSPNATESSGKILEYMAAGIPVVAVDSVNTRSMLGTCGTYAASGSPEDIAKAIVQALDRNDRALLSEQSRLRLRQYDWDHIIKTVTSAYESLR